jgi:hypothetical protein
LTDENRRAAIALELRHAALAMEAAQLLRKAGLLNYERTWEASSDVSDAAFAEVEPFIERLRAHLVAEGWATKS